MLLSRSLPPHFLLPAWGTRQLLRAIQRAHKSTDVVRKTQNPTSSLLEDERSHKSTPLIRFHDSKKGSGKQLRRRAPASSLIKNERGHTKTVAVTEQLNPTPSLFEDEGSRKGTPIVCNDTGMKGAIRSVPLERAESKSSLLEERDHKNVRSLPLERMEPASSVLDGVPASKSSPITHPERMKPKSSLFDELFPEERKATKQSEKKIVEKLPAFDWHEGPKIDWKETVEKAAEERKNWFHSIPPAKNHVTGPHIVVEAKKRGKDVLSVLVLSCASKTLEESDFFRVGSKGEHIEGWTSGIVRVIQRRDAITLEPLGHYFLVFSNEAAASAYLDQTRRLHTLSRTHGGGVPALPFPTKYLRPGEDIKNVLRGFSLVPGQSRLSLRLINRPYSPAVAQVLSDGGPAAIAGQKTGSEDMVLFSVDLGQISHYDLRHAISDDGKRRNLHWNLIDGEGAIVKINSDVQEEDGESIEELGLARSPRKRNIRAPTRYILSFKNLHEARRFIREWHRRPFPVQKEHKVGDEPPPIMNAEMFW